MFGAECLSSLREVSVSVTWYYIDKIIEFWIMPISCPLLFIELGKFSSVIDMQTSYYSGKYNSGSKVQRNLQEERVNTH